METRNPIFKNDERSAGILAASGSLGADATALTWIARHNEEETWTVGFYDPDGGCWYPQRDLLLESEANAHASELNAHTRAIEAAAHLLSAHVKSMPKFAREAVGEYLRALICGRR